MMHIRFRNTVLVLLGLASCLVSKPAWSQQELVDSLLEVLPTVPNDTNKVLLLRDIAWELNFFFDPEEAKVYLDSALQLAEQLNFEKGKGDIYNAYGVFANYHDRPKEALKYFYKSMAIRQKLNDKRGIAAVYNNIGNAHDRLGEFTEALENYLQSLRVREELGDTELIPRLYYNIADLHEKMGNYPEALENILQYQVFVEETGDLENIAKAYNVKGNVKYELDRFEEARDSYQKALEIFEQLEDLHGQSSQLNNLGNVIDKTSEQEEKAGNFVYALKLSRDALSYYEGALNIREELGDTSGVAEIYNNLGLAHTNIGSYQKALGDSRASIAQEAFDKAMEYFQKALDIREDMDDPQGVCEVYVGIVEVYRELEKYSQALELSQKYLEIAEQIDDQKLVQNAYKDLARIYYALEEHQLAYQYREKYDELRYERLDEKRVKDNERKEILYSDRKKQIEIERQKQELLLQDAELRQARTLQYSLLGGSIFLILLALLLYNRYTIKNRANKVLAEKNVIIKNEQERSEALLLNILPKATADELKQHGKAQAKRYDSVTVLFTDFKSFTSIAEQLTPERLVAELDACFREFDRITEAHGVEKIKTIGDAYMCAGGLPTPHPDHTKSVLRAALEIRDFMEEFGERQRLAGKPEFKIRIGIHTGPVVAGIVGNKKFAYDIWGDTVNLAARMESSGMPGQINISKTTYELVKDEFRCTPRGKIAAKNKGVLEMYFVDSAIQDISAPVVS